MSENDALSLLAEGLSGLSTEPSALFAPPFPSAPPSVAQNIAPVLDHLKSLVSVLCEGVIEGKQETLGSVSEKISTLTFSLASSIGTAVLSPEYEDELWMLTTKLWVSSRFLSLPARQHATLISTFISPTEC